MSTLAVERPSPSALPKLFVALLPLIYAVELLVTRLPRARADGVIALAATIDLTIVVPVLYWFLVIRPARAPVGRVVAAFVVSLAVARLILPAPERQYLHLVRYLVAPAELAFVWWLAVRVRRIARESSRLDADLDVPERMRAALLSVMPYRATAEVFATELALFWFALFSLGRPAHAPAGTRAFTSHRRGTTGVFVALLAATAVEAAPVHLLVRVWSPRAAWTLTALSVLAMVWLLGLLRSIQLRPTLLRADALVVRCGLRWTVQIPLDAIARVERARGPLPPKRDSRLLRATLAAQPDLLLTLRRPVLARGMYGTSREVTAVAFAVDDRAGLAAALPAPCPT